MNEVRVSVPSSSANLGIGYDIWSLALEKPNLEITYTKKDPGSSISVGTNYGDENELAGHSGKLALRAFFDEFGIKDGAHLVYYAKDYPSGGLGRSGAEAVAAITAAVLIYKKENRINHRDLIILGSKGEPDEHSDNVAASVSGGFNIITPNNDNNVVLTPPDNLGVLIGHSLYNNTSGTSGSRSILKRCVTVGDFVHQSGLISAATASLVSGDLHKFLTLIGNDLYHEPCRADAKVYGNFSFEEFKTFREKLYWEFCVSMNVSGAGPSMIFMYDKSSLCSRGLAQNKTFNDVVTKWFKERGVTMTLREAKVAKKSIVTC